MTFHFMDLRTGWWEKLVGLGCSRNARRTDSARVVSEGMFHELVAEEMIRSERAQHSWRILIVCFTESPGTVVAMRKDVSGRVMAVLANNLRMTDSVGWYREPGIIGALLTVVGSESSVDHYCSLENRLHHILKTEFAHVQGSLQAIVCGYEEAHQFVHCKSVR